MPFQPTRIVVHCSATREGAHYDWRDIDRWHRARGWDGIGYHAVVLLDGTVEPGRPETRAGAHVAGHNHDSLGICYIGGVGADGVTPKDTRTGAQRRALEVHIRGWMDRYGIPAHRVVGHRELDAKKACPCFDVGALRHVLGAGTRPVKPSGLLVDMPTLRPPYPPSVAAALLAYLGLSSAGAVTNFQARHGLTVDGIVGPQTWRAIIDAHTPRTEGPLDAPISPDED